MIVAGSVLTLLLMGLAVDGFLNPADEEANDPTSDEDGDDVQLDESGGGTGLTDLLFPETLGQSDDVEAEQPSSDPMDVMTDAEGDTTEDDADARWEETVNTLPPNDFVEVEAVTETEDGDEVPYVAAFDTDTDVLVLEFDGPASETPDIEIDHDQEEDAAIVMANGVPVTLVEGGGDMTVEHVRIIMGGSEETLEPQVLFEDTESDVPDAEAARDTAPEGPATLPPPEDTELADEADDTPPTLPLPDDIDPVAEDAPLTRDDGTGADEIITCEVTENEVDPAVDFVDTIGDGVPDNATLNAILDGVTSSLTTSGGIDEALDARAGIDACFGEGGDDAQTGTLNDERITGGDGQNALHGDEGNDTLLAGAGNDEVYGDSGDDVLHGEAGIDFLSGGEGNDTLDGGGDRDLLFGGDGDDVLYGGAANDFLQGGMGADMLNGGSGDDVLDGVFGDGTDQDGGDTLWGGSGDDTLIVGADDVAHGGAGADTFVSGAFVENADVAGRVEDFDPSEDRIEVVFDPFETPDPILEVLDFEDGSGADIILNGEVILSVAGAQGMDPNMIELQAMA